MIKTYWLMVVLLLGLCPQYAVSEEKEAHKGMLQNWEFYGSVRLETSQWKRYRWYTNEPRNWVDSIPVFDPNTGLQLQNTLGTDSSYSSYTDSSLLLDSLPINKYVMGLQANSNFGARGKTEQFAYNIEFGLANLINNLGFDFNITPTENEITVYKDRKASLFLRKLYGDWYIIPDLLTLRLGQNWAITNFFPSSQVFLSDAGLGYSGILYTGRVAQVKLSLGKEQENFSWLAEAAIIKPPNSNDIRNLGVKQHYEEKYPKMEIGTILTYNYLDLIQTNLNLVGGASSYDVVVYEEEGAPDEVGTHALKSNVIGAHIDLKIWKIRTSFVYSQGKNLTSYGVWMGNPFANQDDPSNEVFYPTYTQLDTNGQGVGNPPPKEVANALAKQWGFVINFEILPWLVFESGMARIIPDHEDQSLVQNNERVKNAFERSGYYAQLQFLFADKHVKIVPEWSYSDFGGFKKTKQDDGGGRLYAGGVKFQLDM